MKGWTTPELIVLVRGRPEEGVLDSCKSGLGETVSVQTANPGTFYTTCSYSVGAGGSPDVSRCAACQSISPS
jgi:hypothetical protein